MKTHDALAKIIGRAPGVEPADEAYDDMESAYNNGLEVAYWECAEIARSAGRTDEEIVAETNELAIECLAKYVGTGYEVAAGYKVYEHLDNPRSAKAWRMACYMQEFFTATDPDDALTGTALDDWCNPKLGVYHLVDAEIVLLKLSKQQYTALVEHELVCDHQLPAGLKLGVNRGICHFTNRLMATHNRLADEALVYVEGFLAGRGL